MRQSTTCSFYLILALGSVSSALSAQSQCERSIERATALLENVPSVSHEEFDRQGNPRTENAKVRVASTTAAVAGFLKAQEQCQSETERAFDPVDVASLTAASYLSGGRALEVQSERDASCALYEEGIERVQAIDPQCPRLLDLYDRSAFCVAEVDLLRAIEMREEALDLAIVLYGNEDARISGPLVYLANSLRYDLTRGLRAGPRSGPRLGEAKSGEEQAVRDRVDALYRRAWDLVETDPTATKQAVDEVVASYSAWLRLFGDDGLALLRRAHDLVEARSDKPAS